MTSTTVGLFVMAIGIVLSIYGIVLIRISGRKTEWGQELYDDATRFFREANRALEHARTLIDVLVIAQLYVEMPNDFTFDQLQTAVHNLAEKDRRKLNELQIDIDALLGSRFD
jgi:hypothetical protein